MQLISKFYKGFRLLLCVIDIFSKCGWVIVNGFQKILKQSDRSEAKSKWRKPNKIWVDKGSEFYNNSFKKWLKDNDIEIYSIHNEGNSVVAGKNKIYKYMTAISIICISIN